MNAEFPDTRSFFVVKTDGTKAGFSARKCVDAPPAAGRGRRRRRRRGRGGPQAAARRGDGGGEAGGEAGGGARPGPPPPSGCVVKVRGLAGQGVGYPELREAFGAHAPVKCVAGRGRRRGGRGRR